MNDDLVLGLDVGFAKARATSGLLLARVRDGVLTAVDGPHHLTEKRARERARDICEHHTVRAIAIDAPLAASHQSAHRRVESVFSRGRFQKHCKPAQVNAPSGQRLHAAGMTLMSALTNATYAGYAGLRTARSGAVMEVFPTAALGVLIDASDVPAGVERGTRTDVFFDLLCSRQDGRIGCITLDPALRPVNHDERMATVAAALAACYVERCFTAVGEHETGYFLMPHRSAWRAEWRAELMTTLASVGGASVLDVP